MKVVKKEGREGIKEQGKVTAAKYQPSTYRTSL
jgi:hypothetical protein